MAGTILAPIRASFSMFSKWISLKGVSRGTSTRVRRSLRMTSAHRSRRLPEFPAAMRERVPMLQGQITMASGAFEPLATGARKSFSA